MTTPALTSLLRFPLAAGQTSRRLRRVQPHGPDDREALLRDPELLRALDAVIRGRVHEDDIADVVQETLTAVSLAASLPEDPADRRQYILGICRNKAAEHRRQNRRQVEVQDGVDLQRLASPALAAESAANRDLLTKLVRAVPGEQQSTLRCFARHVMGESLAEIAREVGVDYDVLYKRVTTLQRRLRVTGKALAGIAILALVVGAVWAIVHPKPQIAHQPPATAPTDAPATSTSAPAPEPERDPISEAHQLRLKAFDECTRNDWRACLDDLASASALDHAGDSDPLVQAARNDAQNGLSDKPSSWRPPRVRPYAPKKSP